MAGSRLEVGGVLGRDLCVVLRRDLADTRHRRPPSREHLGCSDHLRPVDQDEVVVADDPSIDERACRHVRDGDEPRVGGVDEAGEVGLAEDVDLARDRVARREQDEFARLARLDVLRRKPAR